MRVAVAVFALLTAPLVAELVDHPEIGVRLERGFSITQVADEKLANDIWCMTLNPRGEIVVSGPGYVSTLLDTNGDGKMDEAVEFVATKGAMGIAFDRTGKQVLIMGDGWLSEYRDENLDRVADGPPRKILPFASGEHGGHAVKRGPDGWWWVIGGNDAGFGPRHGELDWRTRGVGNPEKVRAGALLRISPDLERCEVVADGFRNPYDFTFSARGEPYTFDSDCERDYFLPWYSGCRVYRVRPGRFHGWSLSGHERSFRMPDYLPQTVSALADLGRGSPTGVHAYAGAQFPEHYHGGLLVCDWTFGRVHHLPLVEQDGEVVSRPEVFLEPVGSHGFAPTSLVETAEGEVLVSIGGRKTRGAVYRIRYDGNLIERPFVLPAYPDPPNSVLGELAALQEKLGGWKLKGASAEAFVPYEPANRDGLNTDEKKSAIEKAQVAMISLDGRVQAEAARLLAMLEDTSPLVADQFLRTLTENSTPTADFHFLACLARLRAEPDGERTAKIARAILDLDRKLAGGDRRPKQQWPLRLNEVVRKLIERQPDLADALAEGMSRPGQVALIDALPETSRALAARRFFAIAENLPSSEWTPELVRVLGGVPEARPLLRAQWSQMALRPALRKVLQRNSTPEEAALIEEKPVVPVSAEDVSAFAQSLQEVGWEKGDVARGEKVFRERACAACHAGTSPMGPELSGPVARLSSVDLMTDIQFPNRNVSDAFRATRFTLKDGSHRDGYVVFHSADGVMLQTGPGLTERLAEEAIVQREASPVSPMPAGLLTGLKPEELADLYAYLRTLKGN